jgi:DNA-binding XRE family transcriptional regulator
MARAIISARSIRTLKKRSGLTDAKLAYFTGVRRETFNNWLHGRYTPNNKHVHQLAALYNKFANKPLPIAVQK